MKTIILMALISSLAYLVVSTQQTLLKKEQQRKEKIEKLASDRPRSRLPSSVEDPEFEYEENVLEEEEGTSGKPEAGQEAGFTKGEKAGPKAPTTPRISAPGKAKGTDPAKYTPVPHSHILHMGSKPNFSKKPV